MRRSARASASPGSHAGAAGESPLRAELFSVEQLEEHGKALARIHRLAPAKGHDRLLSRLVENEAALLRIREQLSESVADRRGISPAGEWFLDNFYLLEEQIRTAKRHLPRRYSRELPCLQDGPSAGQPRAYAIALELISHGDGRLGPTSLSRFLTAYQSIATLKLGELWAIPIMLRLALIENLRRIADSVAADITSRNIASDWAARMLAICETDPKNLIVVLADMAKSKPPVAAAFVAELTRRLQGQNPAVAVAVNWIEQWLSEFGLTIALSVQSENQQQAADQASVSNSIGSLRFLGATDWREFVEAHSAVENALRHDPARVYDGMDFGTRDHYRHKVERLARQSRRPEVEVAEAAVALAGNAQTAGKEILAGPADHVGWYLVDAGSPELRTAIGLGRTPLLALREWAVRHAFGLYFGAILLGTMALTFRAMHVAGAEDIRLWMLVLLGLVAFVSISDLVVAMINWAATLRIEPELLPRMNFSAGIPPSATTLVVVPAMLTSTAAVDRLVEALEVRYLGNRDEYLHFALLTDFTDADRETLPDDEPLLCRARDGIDALNKKYCRQNGDTFLLFHRSRQWNPGEKTWMGHERKRGKLTEFNAFLKTGVTKAFSSITGDTAAMRAAVRYVITLDSDTDLPRESARLLVAAMAHPLNAPRYNATTHTIAAGYGILQPRVGVKLNDAIQSPYSRLWASDSVIDPYTRAVSDLYQDVFGEGSYVGKGVYDVTAFERALGERFPNNHILSHDLLEGCYLRSALLSDVQLLEEYPWSYAADIRRRHRWIRGDWQLAGWLRRRVPAAGRREINPLSLLSQWKILDNLRRSLVPASLAALLVSSWFWLASPLPVTLLVLGIIFIPGLFASAVDVLRKPADAALRQHIADSLGHLVRRMAQGVFRLTCLVFEASVSVDAIGRTAVRMLVMRRQLLEWDPSGAFDASLGSKLRDFYRSMAVSPIVAIAVLAGLALVRPEVLAAAVPVLILWLAAPAVAWWTSTPLAEAPTKLNSAQTGFLRTVARRNWAYFETFVTAEDHWLPPDNFQEQPRTVLGHRTSPTNIGLALLANLAAYDFGYLSAGRLLERTAQTFGTLAKLDRYEGHFYNWYDTQSLQPLRPMYVSSVDSGNLAGHLLTVRMGLLELAERPIAGRSTFAGIVDTLDVLIEVADEIDRPPMRHLRTEVLAACGADSPDPAGMREFLERFAAAALVIEEGIAVNAKADVRSFAKLLSHQCDDALAELRFADPASAPARERIGQIALLADQCVAFATADYRFLFDEGRKLLAVGYNVDHRQRDSSYYDLLASEARLANFVAIAEGQLPQESWFALGRLLTKTAGHLCLLSWGGSMFEYLMPLLVMPTYPRTLLDQTYYAAVNSQIEYARRQNVPFGMSESGYYALDLHQVYQYRAFGVPALGLKRELAQDLVIAPYASALALMVAPREACENLQRITTAGFGGRYGFYEAVDYTPSRLAPGDKFAVVQSFMGHHQAMSLLALAYVILDRPMQRRFESDPRFKATLLLLQEQIPKAAPIYARPLSQPLLVTTADEGPVSRTFSNPGTPLPEVHLLSNGRYHLMISNAGAGYSRWNNLAVTRWREDTTCDNTGIFCYLRNVADGQVWSNAYQPTLKEPDSYEAIFSEGRAEFRRRDGVFAVHTEIAVSPEDNLELRRIRITNRAGERRILDVTSYAEVVLASHAEDELHPAFSKLFVQTEILAEQQAIVCTRRPRSREESPPWLMHVMTVHEGDVTATSYETDRARFIGRGRNLQAPLAMAGSEPLSGTQGSVLDPVAAIRKRIVLDPEQTVLVDLVFGIETTREAAISLAEKYRDRRLADRVLALARTHGQAVLRQLNASEADAQLFGRLASAVIFANASLRADPDVLLRNQRGQSGLWGYGISGDLPIVLLRIADAANIGLVRQLVRAHAYWRLKGLAVDLVIWNEDYGGYRQALQEQIVGLIGTGMEGQSVERPGGIFVRAAEQIAPEDRVLLQAVARIMITEGRGTLAEQVIRRSFVKPRTPRTLEAPRLEAPVSAPLVPGGEDLMWWNGLGGFSSDGTEYRIVLEGGRVTPAPWVNVLANATFGTVVSENGAAYTWSENAHEYRLTPWHNDPVTDATGEAFYLRDRESGAYWSPTPSPSRGVGTYLVRHGFGYSAFEHAENGIFSELRIYVDAAAALKYSALTVRNTSDRLRRLSATGYVEWVLGDLRAKSAMHVSTTVDSTSGAIFARNPYNVEFGAHVAFFDVDDRERTLTCDRTEFIGRNGTLHEPAAMARDGLTGKAGGGMDPAGVLQVPFDLRPGEERQIIFRLGMGVDLGDARTLVMRSRGPGVASSALQAVGRQWHEILGAVQVRTPDTSINTLANGWLLYQTLVSRIWGRTGYYQSAGAFGFRDQLQDVMALVHARPDIVREHLLRCAGRQFPEGDVQHWWHPALGRGVRTNCSDDFLWLPLATCRYVLTTGDTSVLQERVAFIDGRQLADGEDSYYDLATGSALQADLYGHCVRAVMRGLRFGVHGLPLMGSGDWNDGMNLVGRGGRGESVWLGFFLYDVLTRFARLAQLQNDTAMVQRCQTEAAALRTHLELHGWDGEWYRRAYFDDGTPLGSASNPECRIDAIPQSWSVLSGAAPQERSRKAMNSLHAKLVDAEHRVVRLLTPAFDTSSLEPGYIKGYVPGVRENGGQYTHSAVWAAMAFADLNDSDRAWQVMDLINPIKHARSVEEAATYKVEPYVVAGDIYARIPHTGRGGWTWYTGAAGWTYRLILESLLGLRREGNTLLLRPCVPDSWSSFEVSYRFGQSVYQILVTRSGNESDTLLLDGHPQNDLHVELRDDHREYAVELRLGMARPLLESPLVSKAAPAEVA